VQVIVTTVRATVTNLGHPVDVDLFNPTEAVDFLTHRTGLHDPGGAHELAEQLGWLPLALAQAAALIGAGRARTYPTYTSYLDALDRATSLDRPLPAIPGSDYPRGLAQAIHLSLQQVTRSDPSGQANRILQLLAVLAPAGVPTTLLDPPANKPRRRRLRRATNTGAQAVPVGSDLGAAVAVITDFAVAVSDVTGTAITMHRLTRRVIHDDLAASGQLHHVIAHAAALVEAAIPADPGIREAWPTCAMLLPHALAVLDPLGEPMLRLAQYPDAAGDYRTAAAVSATLAEARSRALGPDHAETLNARRDLARWTGWTGDAVRARDLLAELLPIRQRVSGPRHPDTLITRHDLAFWTGMAGDPKRARDLFAELLPIWRRVGGPWHPDTLTARYDLADWTGEAGDATGARDQFADLLPLQKQVFGSEHPITLATRYMLARWTGEAGDPTGARDQFANLLLLQERILGPEHPNTLATRYMLAHRTGETNDEPGTNDLLVDRFPLPFSTIRPGHFRRPTRPGR
jgi:hypothetical protein